MINSVSKYSVFIAVAALVFGLFVGFRAGKVNMIQFPLHQATN